MQYNDHTKSEAELYRQQMLSYQQENDLLRNNIRELQGQLQGAYTRIKELREENDNLQRETPNRG